MSEVVHARLDRDLLERVDSMIEKGLFPNRSGLIREATREMVSRAFPEATNDKLEAVARAAAAMIAETKIPGVTRIVLYGSVARRRAGEDSDIDLLVLHDEQGETNKVLTAVIDITAPVATATETAITPIVMRASEFSQALADGFSFAQSVAKDGILLFEAGA